MRWRSGFSVSVLESFVVWLLDTFALPGVGLPAVFIISAISATLLPMGSEPALFAYVSLAPRMFWPAVLVATLGNTLGGAVSYFLGCGARDMTGRWRRRDGLAASAADAADGGESTAAAAEHEVLPAGSRWHRHAAGWLQRLGPKAMLLSWLPGIGDPLCAVAGWMRFPFWPSLAYMALGKFARYVVLTSALLSVVPQAAAADLQPFTGQPSRVNEGASVAGWCPDGEIL